jgi:inner membrane protein
MHIETTMDPLAHTLVGATLAETGLKKTTPLAATTLILGANAPDLDFFIGLVDPDYSLHLRRGITHGVLAMVVLPLVLTGLMVALGRFRSARGKAPPPRPGVLLGLALLSVLTHPTLDWMNTYGVRLLMPFDGRWFYGDALFIVDPWVWLLAASALVLATTRSRLGVGAWLVLGAGATALVFGFPGVPWGVQVVWCGGVAALIAMRYPARVLPAPVARAAVVLVAGYAIAMVAFGALAAAQAKAFIEAREGQAATHAVANPEPGDPFSREVIVVTERRYHFVRVGWLSPGGPTSSRAPLPIPRLDDPIVKAALAQPSIRGFTNWMRLPYVEIVETEGGHRVVLRDLRYSRPDAERFPDFAKTSVELDHALRARRER